MSDLLAFFAVWFTCGIVSIRPFVLTLDDENLKDAEKEGGRYFTKLFFYVIIGGGLSFLVAIYLMATRPYHTEPPEALFEG